MSHIVFDSQKFLRWKKRIEQSGIIIENIEVLGIISRDETSLFGAFLDCRLRTPEGMRVPRCILIGGESVVIIPVLTCQEDKEIYTLMVEQRRIVDGDFAEEFPAGCIDLMEDDPKFTACQELKEELGLVVSPDELIPLGKKRVKTNPSFSDGLAFFFYFQKEVSLSKLKELNGQRTGCKVDGEDIQVKLKKMSEVADCMTSSALIGIKLLERELHCTF